MPETGSSEPAELPFKIYFFIFFITLFFSLLFTPLVGALAIRVNALDRPSGRKLHRRPVPLMGGVAVFISLLLGLILMRGVSSELASFIGGSAGRLPHMLEGVTAGGLVILLIGVVDDIKGVEPSTKLLGQVIAALILVHYGIKIEGISLPFSGRYLQLPVYMTLIFSVLWITAFINSFNLIDGVDGLASGVGAIAGFIFFLILIYQVGSGAGPETGERMMLAALFSLALCGACAGFLKFNFPPAKIFLGDSGSLLLGYMAAVITVMGMLKTAGALTVAVPVIVFGVPLVDTFLSFFRRVVLKKSFMDADKDHIHHRLLYKRGWNEKKVVLRIYFITALLGLAALIITVI